MGKVGIITIFDIKNYGNRLQNYATQEVLKKYSNDVETIKNIQYLNQNYNKPYFWKKKIYHILRQVKYNYLKKNKKLKQFKQFNKNIHITQNFFYTKKFNTLDDYDYLVVGSDQVWNPTFDSLSDLELLYNIKNKNKISFSASFGISELPKENEEKAKKAFKDFKNISVREDSGKEIIKRLTQREDIEVLIDPTLMLSAEEWKKVSIKPKNFKQEKYILNYFLGELSQERKAIIEKIASKNGYKVINIFDKKDDFYYAGPSEFLYLIKNASLICTDSFHSCVFSMIFDNPFIVFNREDTLVSMNSRIETFLNKFNLQNRKFNGEITEQLLTSNYDKAYKILEQEKNKVKTFLSKAFE